MTIVRPASLSDAAAIAHVQVEGWRCTYRGIVPDATLAGMTVDARTTAWREIVVKPEQFTFVAEENGNLVGFINGGPERQKLPQVDGEVYALYVLSHAQGRGLGRLLFERAIQTLIDFGNNSMAVWVLAANSNRQFYERMGGLILAQDEIEIGGRTLIEVAYSWKDLSTDVQRLAGIDSP